MTESSTRLIRMILRILTPEEIGVLTTTTQNQKKIPLSDLLNAYFRGKETQTKEGESNPKEVPSKKKIPKEEIAPIYSCSKKVSGILSEYALYCLEAEKNIFSSKVRNKKKKRGKQLSHFILEEKKKLEEINFKSKRQEIIKLYRETSKVNIEQQRRTKNDLSKSDLSGVLVKKRV